MATEIKLPALGENVESGEVVEIKVAAGEEVEEGQTLLEVEAEKSTVEVPSPSAGRISEWLVGKGDQVTTGQVLCKLGDGDGAKPAAKKEEKPEKKEATKESTEAKKPAEQKAESTSQPTPSAARTGNERAQPTPPSRNDVASHEEEVVPAGPATRRMARDFGVDLSQVPGTAPYGRVTQDDVKVYVRQLASGAISGAASGRSAPLPDFEQWGPVERKPFESIRRKTAERMTLSWTSIPHVTHHDIADVTEVENFRRSQSSDGPKITVTAFALKAAAIMLRQFPQFNTSLDLNSGELVYKHYYHIGVAVDTERGLLVPVIRDVDKKSVHELASELPDVAQRARDKKITAEDMRGATFTISNLGGIGGTGFTPIVNFPEVAILGLTRGRLQPVHKDGQFVPRLLLPLSLSYDHRVIDGADAARFARRLAELLENPLVMLMYA